MITINTNHHYLCTTMTLCQHRVDWTTFINFFILGIFGKYLRILKKLKCFTMNVFMESLRYSSNIFICAIFGKHLRILKSLRYLINIQKNVSHLCFRELLHQAGVRAPEALASSRRQQNIIHIFNNKIKKKYILLLKNTLLNRAVKQEDFYFVHLPESSLPIPYVQVNKVH